MQENQPTPPTPEAVPPAPPAPPAATPPAAPPLPTTPVAPTPEVPKKANTGVIIAVIVLVLLVLSVAGYFAYKSYYPADSSNLYTPVPTAYTTPSPTSEETSSPSASPAANTGVISGTICYPSEGIPAGKIEAKNTTTNITTAFDNPQNSSTFSVSLPKGSYKLRYKPASGTTGYYTSCTGSEASCQDNQTKRTAIAVAVEEEKTVQNVKICDYYYTAGMEPDF